MNVGRLILQVRHGSGLSQRDLAEKARTSQAALSAYERGLKSPSLAVAERIVEAAGYHLDLVTEVHFTQHAAPTVRAFWVPDRLWRGKLPECFSKVYLDDETRFGGVAKFDLRRRPQRRRFYELLLRRGKPADLMDWIDGALLVDLWDDLKIPLVIRNAWQPAVTIASNGPPARPWYGPMG